jgi:uncharacterized GH25 family protein
MLRSSLLLAGIMFTGVPASAHDLWLIPPEAALPGKSVLIRANQGDDFPKSDKAPDVSSFGRRLVIAPDGQGTLEAAGMDEQSGLLRFTPSCAGVHILAVETKPKLIALEADKFNHYLVSEGLLAMYRLRVKEKSLDQPGRERYSKSPKALVQIGTGGGDPCRVVGMPLEIVPLKDPFALKVGDTLRVRVLFRGKPLPDAVLGVQWPDDGEDPRATFRTDARGEALLPIARTGLLTVRLTHMTRPKAETFEWESFWTTLTFRLPE